jgi:hypothetical protein
MRAHECTLQLGQPRAIDPRARKETESGVDAVHRLPSGKHAPDGGSRRIDRRSRGEIDEKLRTFGPNMAQLS